MNPAGRAILKSCHYEPDLEHTTPEYPLQLSNGRIARHFHTRTKTGRTKELQGKDPEPWVQISLEDAESLAISEGEFALVESRRGKVELRVRVGDIKKGCVFIPFHYGYFDVKDGRARAANELTQGMYLLQKGKRSIRFADEAHTEQWDPVSKQPMFKSGAVRVSKLPPSQSQGSTSDAVSAPEQQSAAVTKAEENKTHLPTGTKEDRFLEYYLGVAYSALANLRDICDHLPNIVHDHEVSLGMRIMHRILTKCHDKLEPFVQKYHAKAATGQEVVGVLRKHLFADTSMTGGVSGSPAFDTLIALQNMYLCIGYVEAHLVALTPTAQASWDVEFGEAVGFVKEQLDRVKAWTTQQLAVRAPQALLVPCREASALEGRLKEGREE